MGGLTLTWVGPEVGVGRRGGRRGLQRPASTLPDAQTPFQGMSDHGYHCFEMVRNAVGPTSQSVWWPRGALLVPLVLGCRSLTYFGIEGLREKDPFACVDGCNKEVV